MKSVFVILVLFSWFFLAQGTGSNTNTVVGPFQSQEQCRKIASEAANKSPNGWVVLFRVTSCWEATEKK